MTVTLWDYGAHLVSVRTPDRNGVLGEVVVGPTKLAHADDPNDRGGFRSATVGRYANRIANAAFTLDDTTYELAANDGPNHLHGGRIGFDQYIWQAEVLADTADTAGAAGGAVRFTHHSPDGDEGYPGAVTAQITFTLDSSNRLTLSYHATCDAPTVVNMTNHVYWNLAGAGTIHEHELRIRSDRFVQADSARIPIADPITDVAGTRFDFRRQRPIGGQWFTDPSGAGYDDCYVLDTAGSAGEVAALYDSSSGRLMTVTTDQPGMQLYTANHLSPPHTGVCLETQALPDSPNRAAFPSPTLRPGQVWSSETSFLFSA